MLASLASPTEALSDVLRIAGIGVAIASAELLALPSFTGPSGLLVADTSLTRRAWMVRRPRVYRGLLAVLGGRSGQAIVAIRGLAAVLVVIQPGGVLDARWAALAVAISTLALRLRSPNATHASGAMSVVVMVSAAAALLIGTQRAMEISLWFIAAQAWLSYLTAGASKAEQRSWRTGDAIIAVLSTTMWGNRRTAELLTDHPRLALAASWGTILGECSIPLTLVLPLQIGVALLAVALFFHIVTAFEMGLNNFAWMFPATYPAIIFAWHFVHG